MTAVWAAIVVVVTYALVRYLFEPGLRGGFRRPSFQAARICQRPGNLHRTRAILSIAFAVRAPRARSRVIAAVAIAPSSLPSTSHPVARARWPLGSASR